MERNKSSLVEKCRQLEKSENYQGIKNFMQENKEDIRLEEHVGEFKEEVRKYAKWLGENFGVNAKK
ncbi:MAG: hypothetical protein NUV74_18400 [Candidatus Brocadiaceae bacterium]|nr:hypothetical protein [Candidatus Brocadiaceae bacterium]